MEDGQFAHLHAHYETSLLDGINRIDSIPAHAKEMGMSAVAMTDHGNLSGAYQFHKACVAADIKPIIGIEAYYTVGDHKVKEKDDLGENYYHLILLALNNTGLHNLFKLSSLSYTEGMYYKPRISDLLINQYSEGLFATSACLGSRASQLIMKGNRTEAENLITHHAEMFKDRFAIEVQLHKGEQQEVNKVLIGIADQHNLPLVVTADCHYTSPEDKQLHEIALCMQTNDKLSNPKRFSFGDIDVHFASQSYMEKGCTAMGIPMEAITNTKYVANMVDSKSYFEDRRNHYPTFKGLPVNLPPWEALERVARGELTKKMGSIPKVYEERLTYELRIIKQMGLYDYLLIVWEFLNGVREVDVLVGPGRGCFVPGSRVKLTDGTFRPIELVAVGDKVLGHDSSEQVVENVLAYEVDEDLIELNFSSGHIIACTLDHEFFTLNRGWVRARDLTGIDNIIEV